ncbi:MAG TPA: hypothetical protein VH165_21510 [Kofleriaceae bacterium]|nr:hypothetical protein [Kofleriaceae bacterium]
MTVRTVGWALGAALAVLCGIAHADRADQLFKKGKRLLAEKHYAEACTAFQDSDRLDPGIGAKLNVARCYQEWGKLATAYRWFSEAEQLAKELKDDRAKKIRSLIDELEPSIPRLTVKAPADAITTNLVLSLDGKPLDPAQLGISQRVDPGPHQIDYTVDGRNQEKVIPIERGGSSELVLDLPVKHRKVAKQAAAHDDDSGGGGGLPVGTRKLIGLGVTGAGVVALGVAGIVTLHARTDYHHAIDAHCRGVTDMCDAVGQAAAASAKHRANIATGVSIGGLVAVAGGLIVFLTAPRGATPIERSDENAMYLAPLVSRDGGSLVLGGAF